MPQLHPQLYVLINDRQQLIEHPDRNAVTETIIGMAGFDIMRRAHADDPGKAFQIDA